MIRRVLAYDDEPEFRHQLENVFYTLRNDYQLLETFSNTSRLEENIREHQPDIIVMDIQMNADDEGIIGLYRVKMNFPHIKVMMLTSFEHDQQILHAISLGADGYMLKSDFTSQQLPHLAIQKSFKLMLEGGAYLTPLVARRVMDFFFNPGLSDQMKGIRQRFQQLFNKQDKQDYPLTKKQKEVLQKLAEGKTTAEIAEEMLLSENTVNTHIKGIYGALEVNKRSLAVKKAIEARLVS